MRFKKEVILIAPFFVLLTLGIGAWSGSAQALDCTTAAFQALGLTDETFSKPVTNLTATPVAAVPPLPAYCDVRGAMWPEIDFAVKLPATWNKRFYMIGNAGAGGSIDHTAMQAGMIKGFTAAGTNGGHTSSPTDYSWAYPSPTNLNTDQKKIDQSYRAVHETAVIAKKIIKAYYGSDVLHSYWNGCSRGGGQGMREAQKFPEDFDGLLVGAPAIDAVGTQIMNTWVAQALQGEGEIDVAKLPILSGAVYGKCDGIDGLVDGLIDDPRNCTFDPAKDLPQCPGDVDGPACFTTHQVQALQKIYGGPKTSTGQPLFPGWAPGSEANWNGSVLGAAFSALIASSFMRYMAFTPPAGPTYDFMTFNFDADPAKMADAAALYVYTEPDLRRLKNRGGKIIHYHGWADQQLTPFASVNYYQSVLSFIGEKPTKEFYKLYLVPGAAHCGGGAGCFDNTGDLSTIFDALVNWVENGVEPEVFIGHRIVSNQVVRTRPLCPYPEVPRYLGAGSIDDATNFTCVKTIPAKVRIEPEMLKLHQ